MQVVQYFIGEKVAFLILLLTVKIRDENECSCTQKYPFWSEATPFQTIRMVFEWATTSLMSVFWSTKIQFSNPNSPNVNSSFIEFISFSRNDYLLKQQLHFLTFAKRRLNVIYSYTTDETKVDQAVQLCVIEPRTNQRQNIK